MGESQSAGWSAEAGLAGETNEGEAECLRVVEIAQRYYLIPLQVIHDLPSGIPRSGERRL